MITGTAIAEDIELLKALNVQHYRMGLPNGPGFLNHRRVSSTHRQSTTIATNSAS